MTRRKKYKIRDKDQTKTGFISAVGDILKELGHKQLDASKIARRVGRDPRLIRDYYGSLNGLLKTYFEQKDYWKPFFERFTLPESATDEQIRDLFTELMQENLKYFSGDPEMQNAILWQISEVSSLMRSVSQAREVEGAKLLGLTDRHFKDSDINFRVVIAILLYGTYALVLHARYNKSSVCGIDINNERDWWAVHRGITLIINLVWAAADQPKLNDKSPKMNYEFEYLENLAEEQARARGTVDADIEPAEKLVMEVKRLKRKVLSHLLSLENEMQTRTYLQVNLHSLVSVCDVLYDPSKKHNPDAELILGMIEAVRRNMNAYIPGNLAIPELFRNRENVKFQLDWQKIQQKMLAKNIDAELIVLAGIPFARFAENVGDLEWSDFKYLRKYARRMGIVLDEQDADQQALLHTMIGLGFNDPRFIKYCHQLMELKIADSTETEKVRILKRHRTKVRQLIEYTSMRYDHYKKPIVKELIKWVEAELDTEF